MEGWEIVRGVVWSRKFGGGRKGCGLEEEGGRGMDITRVWFGGGRREDVSKAVHGVGMF